MRQSRTNKDVNKEAEEAMAMEAVTRRQHVNGRMCELAIAV
jgi:hypothetical protein